MMNSMLQKGRQVGVGLFPPVIIFLPIEISLLKHLPMTGKIFVHLLRDVEFLIRQTEAFSIGIDKLHSGFTMGFLRTGNLGDPFSDQGSRNNKLRLSGGCVLRGFERGQETLPYRCRSRCAHRSHRRENVQRYLHFETSWPSHRA